jgi:hypothetical protein
LLDTTAIVLVRVKYGWFLRRFYLTITITSSIAISIMMWSVISTVVRGRRFARLAVSALVLVPAVLLLAFAIIVLVPTVSLLPFAIIVFVTAFSRLTVGFPG